MYMACQALGLVTSDVSKVVVYIYGQCGTPVNMDMYAAWGLGVVSLVDRCVVVLSLKARVRGRW